MEFMNHINQEEEHGTQSQDGKNIREKDNVRVFGNCKDRRNRIDRKDQISTISNTIKSGVTILAPSTFMKNLFPAYSG